MRQFNSVDKLLKEIDVVLRTLIPPAKRSSNRETPGIALPDATMTLAQKKHTAGLMRVNHAGEVCAQALYQGQALTAKLEQVKKQMNDAAAEENDHLAWCEQRLCELDSRPSFLNGLWYSGSFMIGAIAGLAGDRFSLGFVAETEKQVSSHLQKHLYRLPKADVKTRLILEQMQQDEMQHAELAMSAGGVELLPVIKKTMGVVAKIMTHTSYYV